MKLKALLLGLALLLPLAARPDAAAGEPVTVFAAASLTDAMTEIGAALEQQGVEVRFSFAASSTLARQIEAGAPADLFFSANERWMDYLEQKGLIAPESRVNPVGNTLVVAAGPGWRGGAATAGDFTDLLLDRDEKLALGDPAHVPSGIYAKQALEREGLWDTLHDHLVFADNVRAALALVERGEAALGIVYQTDLALSGGVEVFYRFPAASHDPITYSLARLSVAPSSQARLVYSYLLSEEARTVFEAYGFEALD